MLRNLAIEDGPIDEVCLDLNAIYAILPDISLRIHELPEVDLAVFNGDETNQMGPVGHDEGKTWRCNPCGSDGVVAGATE